MSVAEQLGEYVTQATAKDLPPQAMEYASMLIASTFASAAFGTTIDSARIIRDLARDKGGRKDATLWFDPETKLPVEEAARANAVTSDAAASDDSDLRNIVHAGTPATAVSLAMAEKMDADGEAVLAAIVLGYEAAGRIGGAMPGFRQRGFHGSFGAVFAATVAAGRLISLDAMQMAHAIALAATSIGGLVVAADTSTAREYHANLAALLGVEAAQAASRGYQAELSVFEVEKGFFECFGGVDGAHAGTLATADFGESFDIITEMAIKLGPGSHYSHSIAEAAAKAAQLGDISPDDVESISVSRPDLKALRGPLHPQDLIGMAHSSAYFAAGVADREFSWVHALPEKIADPVIHRLIDTVQLGDPPPDEEAHLFRQGSTVTIRTRDGRIISSTVYQPRGTGALGIEWSDVDEKYRALMPHARVSEADIEASLNLIHGFENGGSSCALTSLLRPGRV